MDVPLFRTLPLRGRTFRNRIAISPMCTYSARDGFANDFHLAHYGRFGLGGAGLVMLEATAVLPEGRISHGDLGLWSDAQIEPLARIARLLHSTGAAVGIQLCHAGRKAARQRAWQGNGPIGAADDERGEPAWPIVSASPIAMGDGYTTPEELTHEGMETVRRAFVDAVGRARFADFDVVEIHAAHGFLFHSYMSPLTNRRTDEHGGEFEARHRFVLDVAGEVREAWAEDRPLFVRASMLDGAEGGRDFAETVRFAAALRERGVDLVDCSSGGIGGHSASTSGRKSATNFGFQIPFAARLRAEAGIATMAVGLITEARLADRAVAEGHADLVAIGRQALVDPNWPLVAETDLGAADPEHPFRSWPEQYGWWLDGRRPILARLGADGLGRIAPDRETFLP